MNLQRQTCWNAIGEHPLRQFASVQEAVRRAIWTGGVFAKGRREQDRIHSLRQLVTAEEFLGELVIGAVAQNKLDLVARGKQFEVLHVKAIRLAEPGHFTSTILTTPFGTRFSGRSPLVSSKTV